MINAIELTLLGQFKNFWTTTVANIGTLNDAIPDIFAGLPATGSFGANQAAIADNFKKISTGNPNDDLTFLLQYPAAKGQLPAVTVEVGPESEEEVLGNFIQQDFNNATLMKDVQLGGVFSKNYSIGIYSFQPDLTLYLYCLVKYALLIFRGSIDGISNIAISSRQMAVDFERFGDAVYYRYIDIRVEGVIDTVVEHFKTVRKVTVSNSIINSVNPKTL